MTSDAFLLLKSNTFVGCTLATWPLVNLEFDWLNFLTSGFGDVGVDARAVSGRTGNGDSVRRLTSGE